MKKNLFALFVLFLIVSCDSTDENLLIGKWEGVKFMENGAISTTIDAKDYQFEFRDDKTYTYKYATQVENGTYRTVSYRLYTTGEGQKEIAVDMSTLTSDTLVFEMNQGGNEQQLTLVSID